MDLNYRVHLYGEVAEYNNIIIKLDPFSQFRFLQREIDSYRSIKLLYSDDCFYSIDESTAICRYDLLRNGTEKDHRVLVRIYSKKYKIDFTVKMYDYSRGQYTWSRSSPRQSGFYSPVQSELNYFLDNCHYGDRFVGRGFTSCG